ncbi:MAG: choice-of-anchor D domain-containing protein, partial [Deltaproteobacteria bacterium]|nr:choice-of-anchor D domain-containing protein [Deltaproteobacteria bacterium]
EYAVPSAPDITVTDNKGTTDDLALPFGNVTENDSADAIVTITNDGNQNLDIGTITSPSPPFSINDAACSGQTLAPGENCVCTITFAPEAAGAFSGSFSIPSNDPDENPVSVSLSGNGVSAFVQYTLTVDTLGQGTVTLDPPGGSYAVGTQVEVTAAPANGWTFFACGGEFPSFNNPCTLTVNTDTWIDAIFIEPINESASLTLLPGDTVADYRIMSMPLLMIPDSPTSLTNQMGAYDTTLMRMAAWNWDTQLLVEYPDLIIDSMADPFPGEAAWFLFRYGRTFNFEGYKTPEFDGPIMDKMGYFLEIGSNWNMVGNPYNYPIQVSSLIITAFSGDVLLTQDNTLTQGVFWLYQNGVYVNGNNAILQPGEGGWIKVLAPYSEHPAIFFPSGLAARSVETRSVVDTTGLERPPAPPGAISSTSDAPAASGGGGCFISAME